MKFQKISVKISAKKLKTKILKAISMWQKRTDSRWQRDGRVGRVGASQL